MVPLAFKPNKHKQPEREVNPGQPFASFNFCISTPTVTPDADGLCLHEKFLEERASQTLTLRQEFYLRVMFITCPTTTNRDINHGDEGTGVGMIYLYDTDDRDIG